MGPFGCITELGAKRAEIVQKFAPQSRVGIFRNEHARSTPLDPKLTFWCLWYYLGLFGTVLLRYGTRCKNVVLGQKFVPRSRVGIFHNERTRSTPLDPKMTFWCVSYYLGAFETIWLPYETRCKTCAKVHATKSRWNFFATNAPETPHRTLN